MPGALEIHVSINIGCPTKGRLHFSEFWGITIDGQNLLWLLGVYCTYQNFGAFIEATDLHNSTMKLTDILRQLISV